MNPNLDIKHGDFVTVSKLNEGDTAFKYLHKGRVVGLTTYFAQVYRAKKRKDEDGADTAPENSEWFAINGPRIRVQRTPDFLPKN